MFSNSPAFLRTIYDNDALRGQIRTTSLLEDIEPMLQLPGTPRHIIDLGGGHAPVSRILLERYSELTLTLIEPDQDLRNRAKLEISGSAAERMAILEMTFQEAAQTDIFNHYSIILCHGVAGWLDEPAYFLDELVKLAKTSLSPMSLLIGQFSGHLANLVIAGELDKASTLLSTSSRRFPSSHSVDGVYQFSESELLKIIASAGGKVKDIIGVRVLTDLVQDTSNISREQILLLEQQARQLPELRPLANMLHVMVTF